MFPISIHFFRTDWNIYLMISSHTLGRDLTLMKNLSLIRDNA